MTLLIIGRTIVEVTDANTVILCIHPDTKYIDGCRANHFKYSMLHLHQIEKA